MTFLIRGASSSNIYSLKSYEPVERYVNLESGSNSNDGKTPETAWLNGTNVASLLVDPSYAAVITRFIPNVAPGAYSTNASYTCSSAIFSTPDYSLDPINFTTFSVTATGDWITAMDFNGIYFGTYNCSSSFNINFSYGNVGRCNWNAGVYNSEIRGDITASSISIQHTRSFSVNNMTATGAITLSNIYNAVIFGNVSCSSITLTNVGCAMFYGTVTGTKTKTNCGTVIGGDF